MDDSDLNILILARRDGQEQTELPGLFIAEQPRRPARGRQSDRLILYLAIAGNAPIPPDQQTHLLSRLSQTYFKTPGSATAAQRAVADALNQYMLERNQRGASSGKQAVGLLSIITVRSDHLYLAQCGPMHTFMITAAGVKHIHDPQLAGRGLGLGRNTAIHYSQADLKLNDSLVISPEPPPTWSANTLSELHTQGPEGLRRRLLNQAGPNLNAVMLQVRKGNGKTILLPVLPSQTIVYAYPKGDEMEPAAETPYPIEATPVLSDEAAWDTLPQTEEDAASPVAPASSDTDSIVPAAVIATGAAMTAEAVHQLEPAETQAQPAPRSERRSAGRERQASIAAAFSMTAARIGLGARNLFLRMLPGESIATLPSSVMFIVAIAVPLIVVTIAAVVYFQRGRAGQFQAYYAQAVQAAGYARSLSDPNQKAAAWQEVINYVEQAETYEVTSETQALRNEANLVFDANNLVMRLAYQPALTGKLPDSARITRLVATEGDLYMFNEESGSVIRSFATGNGYEIDPTFQCATGTPTNQTGQLIDIAQAPKVNDYNATVLALDVNGNLLQCIPGQTPVFTTLAPPGKGWGSPQAITTDLGNLYVLDPQKNTVWIYWNSSFLQPPEEAFIASFPMQDVIDIVVDKSEIYLLHEDGHTTLCTYSEISVAPSRCTDPLSYVDSRPGREGQTMEIQPPFSQLLSTQPPDPSLYYLQATEHAIYRFSLRLLTYYGQFRPENEVETGATAANKPATAFALRPDARVAFLAVGNQIYYAGMP